MVKTVYRYRETIMLRQTVTLATTILSVKAYWHVWIDIFGVLLDERYGYIWCQNDNNETFCQIIFYDFINICNWILFFLTPPRNRGGVIFSLQFVCVSVCLCVCLSVCPTRLVNKIPAERMHRFARCFLLNGCFPHWLGPYWIWWPWVKGQDHSDVIPIFS